jgi:hypothetical protein
MGAIVFALAGAECFPESLCPRFRPLPGFGGPGRAVSTVSRSLSRASGVVWPIRTPSRSPAQPHGSGHFLEKVRRPDLRGLVRERLDRRTAALSDSAPDPVSLGLVLGPPGSGKTTLLSHLGAAAGDAAAWYRVGTEDDEEIALARHIGHTLGAALGASLGSGAVQCISGLGLGSVGRLTWTAHISEDFGMRPVLQPAVRHTGGQHTMPIGACGTLCPMS